MKVDGSREPRSLLQKSPVRSWWCTPHELSAGSGPDFDAPEL